MELGRERTDEMLGTGVTMKCPQKGCERGFLSYDGVCVFLRNASKSFQNQMHTNGAFQDFEHKKWGISMKKHVVKTGKEPNMNMFDFWEFQKKNANAVT